MNLLFVHQNMPGQYRALIQWLAQNGSNQIVFLTQPKDAPKINGVQTVVYQPHGRGEATKYGLSKVWEEAAATGYGAAIAADKFSRESSFKPDIIIGHTGWGELLFFKDVWPDVPVIGFFEYYYGLNMGLIGFDPDEKVSSDMPFLLRARNTVPYASIETVDLGHCPTKWQASLFPDSFQERMYVQHDGIRTDKLLPNPDASLALGRLDRPLTRDDEAITYIARNLEHARGFLFFVRALPKILDARPNARVIVLGGQSVSYGRKSKHPAGLRGEMETEVGENVDWDRVHFLGRVPYDAFRSVVQLSRCHIYLTMPFVLSWSLLEAMSMEATIVSTDVAPVREVVEHGTNGMLVDFFDHSALADQVIDILENGEQYSHLGKNARAHVVANYDFLKRCLPEHLARINDLVSPKVGNLVI